MRAVRPTPLLVALCVILSTLGIAACGEDGQSAPARASAPQTSPVENLLEATFGEPGRTPGSGRIDVDLRVRGAGLGVLRGPLSVRLEGPFDLAQRGGVPRFDISTIVDSPGHRVRSGAVSTGRAGFVRMRGRTYELPPELYAVVREVLEGPDGRGSTPSFRSLGIDPRRWLTGASRRGVDSVDGTRAVRVSGPLNVPRMLDDLDTMIAQAAQMGMLLPGQSIQGLSPAQRRRIEGTVRSATADIWMGEKDHVLRRLDVDVDLEDRGALRLRLGIAGVDEPQEVRAPQGAAPFSELLTGGLGGLLKSLSAEADPDDKAAGARQAAGALECVQQAASDPEALQRCALNLLGGPPTRGSP